MDTFIIIYKHRTYLRDTYTHYETHDEHVEFGNVKSVERFINLKLQRNRWMKPSDFRVYSARRASMIAGGKPVENYDSSRC